MVLYGWEIRCSGYGSNVRKTVCSVYNFLKKFVSGEKRFF
jgi:hypothetical protein